MAARALIVLSLCLLAAPLCLYGQSHCTAQQLQGTYVYTSTLYVYVVPTMTVGMVTVAGTGDTSSKFTAATSMGTQTATVAGKLTVQPDCTLSWVNYHSSGELKLKGVVLNNGEEIRLVQVDPVTMQVAPGLTLPATNSAVMYRLSAGANTPNYCSWTQIIGRYAQYCTGWIQVATTPAPVYLPTAFNGTISSTGHSKFSGSGTMVVGGQAVPAVYKDATVSINPDCTGTASFSFEGMPGTWTESLAVLEQGKRMISITTSGQALDLCHFTRMDK